MRPFLDEQASYRPTTPHAAHVPGVETATDYRRRTSVTLLTVYLLPQLWIQDFTPLFFGRSHPFGEIIDE